MKINSQHTYAFMCENNGLLRNSFYWFSSFDASLCLKSGIKGSEEDKKEPNEPCEMSLTDLYPWADIGQAQLV